MTVTTVPRTPGAGLGLSRKQLRSIVQADARVNLWTGAIRSGKTISSLLRWLMFVNDAPLGGQLVIVGRTRQAVARNVFAALQDQSLFGPVAKQVTYTPGADSGYILGRRVWVFGASDTRAEMTMRGMTVAGAYGDETTLWSEDLWKTLLGRMSVEGAQLFGTTNPDNPGHWFKTGAIDRAAALGWRHFHFLMEDNPSLPDWYEPQMRREYTGLYFRRFILGEWVQAEGAIYEAWDVDRHVIPYGSLPVLDHVIATGVDQGTTNRTAGYLLGIGTAPSGESKLYVVAEWSPQRNLADVALSASYRSWVAELAKSNGWRPDWHYVDPAAASFRLQLFNDGLGNVVGASNAVLPGIRTVQSLLATDRLQVADSCRMLTKYLPGYAWDPKATKRGEDAPIKVDDHEVDALRYAIHSSRATWRSRVPLTAARPDAPGADDLTEAA